MALSSFSTWETAPQFFDSEMTSCFPLKNKAELLAGDHFLQYYRSYYNNSNFSDSFLDDHHPWYYDPYDLLNLENHGITTDDPLLLLHNNISFTTPDIFPRLDFHPYPYPKRQKSFQDCFYPDFTFANGFAPNSCSLPELLLPVPGVLSTPLLKCDQLPEASLIDRNRLKVNNEPENIKIARKKVEEKCVSAQSIAARERRRKISEKTQELGKLVPGGSKMNTAEMLTAAYNYVKYMQAQVSILEFMGSFQEMKDTPPAEELHVVASPIIQEKLYLENCCLVPKEFVEIIAIHFDAQSKSSLSPNLNQLLASSN